MNASQTGNLALVNGQQSYDIVFPIPFSAVPTYVNATVQMPNDSAEIFEASADLSTLTVNGVTVWLTGVPTALSAGGRINWLAIGDNSVPPPASSALFTGIRVVDLFNRVGRRARGGDFTKLSMNGKQDIMQACNSALQRLYNALPTYFKEQTQGFILPAPLAVTGISVTANSKTISGYSFTDAQFGQSIVLEGDGTWNQIIGENELLVPYMGPTGIVNGTIYGNALHSTTFPLDRIIGNPQFANQSLGFLTNTMMVNINNQATNWLWQQNVGVPQAWWPQVFGNSQGNRPIMVMRFAPAPNQAYAMTVRIGFWPRRLTLDDYANNAEIVVPDQFVEPCLIPMALEEFMPSPDWLSTPMDSLIVQRGKEGEQYARLQYGQVASPNNRVFTPLGW